MKSQKGVSAISLMITIVIIILIAGFSIFFSRDTVVEGNIAKTYAEIKEIQEVAKELSIDSEYAAEILNTYKLENIDEMNPKVGGLLNGEKTYYYLGYADDSINEVEKQTLNERLGVRSITGSYIIAINGVGDVNVYLVDGIDIDGETYYTYDAIYEKYAVVNQK